MGTSRLWQNNHFRKENAQTNSLSLKILNKCFLLQLILLPVGLLHSLLFLLYRKNKKITILLVLITLICLTQRKNNYEASKKRTLFLTLQLLTKQLNFSVDYGEQRQTKPDQMSKGIPVHVLFTFTCERHQNYLTSVPNVPKELWNVLLP